MPAVVILFSLIVPAARPEDARGGSRAAMYAALVALFVLRPRRPAGSRHSRLLNVAVGSVIAVGSPSWFPCLLPAAQEVSAARELGSYRLEEKLGQGGMGRSGGRVSDGCARPAAIKLIRPSVTGDARPGVSSEAALIVSSGSPVIAALRSAAHGRQSSISVADDGASTT